MIAPPAPECEYGYTFTQIGFILGDRMPEFNAWMVGQTGAICEGRSYDHETSKYVISCGGIAHGMVVYSSDLHRFMAGLSVID